MNLFKCTLRSKSFHIPDQVKYLQCSSYKKLKGMFEQCFDVPGSLYYGYDRVDIIENITIDNFDIIDSVEVNMPDTTTTILSKTKLRKIIKKIVYENKVMVHIGTANAVDYLVNVVIRKVKGKASSETIREIVTKSVERKLKYLENKKFIITDGQAVQLHKFCHDCKTTDLDKDGLSCRVTLCSKHKGSPALMKQMLGDGRRYYCPGCNMLSYDEYMDDTRGCIDANCRVERFNTK